MLRSMLGSAAFRESDANEWTGDAASLFDERGKLTELGATRLGGAQNGFREGMSASGDGNSAGVARWDSWLLVMAVVAAIMLIDIL